VQFSFTLRRAQGPTGAVSPRMKWPGHETDHSLQSSATPYASIAQEQFYIFNLPVWNGRFSTCLLILSIVVASYCLVTINLTILYKFSTSNTLNNLLNVLVQIANSQAKVKVILRPTVCRSVRLGIRYPPGTRDQFFPLSIFFYSFGFIDMGRPL
jgi:hypothetical protein